MSLTSTLDLIKAGKILSVEESSAAFDFLFEGDAREDEIVSFLVTLHARGESTDEILGAVRAMRARMITISAPPHTIDIVGTGGDGKHSLNISTAAALVTSACGLPVAKHGNRAATSLSGSSDVLSVLGINLEVPLPVLEECLATAHLCFLFAPRHHPAMRHVAPIRKKIATRTIFNLLGPLTNPANVKRHLIGVYDEKWLRPMAEVLRSCGSQSAWLTHGQDGMDELTTVSDSNVVTLDQNKVGGFIINPKDAHLTVLQDPTALLGGDAKENAQALLDLLKGTKSAYRDIVLLNAAAALVIGGKVDHMSDGVNSAAEAIDNGAALATLKNIIRITKRYST